MTWLSVVWEWLKVNWKWLILPIGVITWLVGRASAKKVVVVSPELSEHMKVKQEAHEEAARKQLEASKKHEAELSAIEHHYESEQRKLTESEKKKIEEIKDDPEALNRFLKDVGRGRRDPKA